MIKWKLEGQKIAKGNGSLRHCSDAKKKAMQMAFAARLQLEKRRAHSAIQFTNMDASTQTEAEEFLTSTIYGLESRKAGPDKIYVGRTQNSLPLRMALHKSCAKDHRPNQCRSKELIDAGECVIFALEEIVGTDETIRLAEQYWIDFFGDKCINRNRAAVSSRNAKTNFKTCNLMLPQCDCTNNGP